MELKRPVGAHCHGSRAQWEENCDKLVAKKKLYVASVVCLVFMIGEVIGKSPTEPEPQLLYLRLYVVRAPSSSLTLLHTLMWTGLVSGRR